MKINLNQNMTEKQFSKKVRNYIENRLKEKYPLLKIKEEINILNSLTIGNIGNKWKIILGFSGQDIVIYKDAISVDEIKNDRIFIPRSTKDKKIIIPLAVFELKIGANLVTHHFITYGAIAKQLKSVFPHCVYYFVSSGGKRNFNPETLLRHTKEFDRVFLDWNKEKENIVKNLLLHLDHLREMKVI